MYRPRRSDLSHIIYHYKQRLTSAKLRSTLREEQPPTTFNVWAGLGGSHNYTWKQACYIWREQHLASWLRHIRVCHPSGCRSSHKVERVARKPGNATVMRLGGTLNALGHYSRPWIYLYFRSMGSHFPAESETLKTWRCPLWKCNLLLPRVYTRENRIIPILTLPNCVDGGKERRQHYSKAMKQGLMILTIHGTSIFPDWWGQEPPCSLLGWSVP